MSPETELVNAYDLKQLRHTRGLTIRGLAEDAGVSYARLSQWENGKEMMGKGTAQKLADVLDKEWGQLYSVQLIKAARVKFEQIQLRYQEGKLNNREMEAELYKLLWTIADRRQGYDQMAEEVKSLYHQTLSQIHAFLTQHIDMD